MHMYFAIVLSVTKYCYLHINFDACIPVATVCLSLSRLSRGRLGIIYCSYVSHYVLLFASSLLTISFVSQPADCCCRDHSACLYEQYSMTD